MSERRQEETLSDVVARRIVMFRKRRDMTRDQLAARCAELGYPALTGPALANIETGRRGSAGQRRREVTVDELMILARALKVAPALLMFPVGDQPTVQLFPESQIETWEAAKWAAGEAYMQDDVNEHWAVPLYLFREHDRRVGDLAEAVAVSVFASDDDKQDQPQLRARAEHEVRRVRAEIRRHGLTPPTLEPGLEYLDEVRQQPMTVSEVESAIARGGTVRLVDDARPGRGKIMRPGDAARLEQQIAAGRRLVEEFDEKENQ